MKSTREMLPTQSTASKRYSSNRSMSFKDEYKEIIKAHKAKLQNGTSSRFSERGSRSTSIKKSLSSMGNSLSGEIFVPRKTAVTTWRQFFMHYLTLPHRLLNIIMEDRFLKNLDEKYMDVVVVIVKGLFFVLLAAFVYYYYLIAITKYYVSLSKSSGVCNEVPRYVTGNFEMDKEGWWSGQNELVPSRTVYTLQAYAFAHNSGEFVEYVQWIRSEVAGIAAGSHSRTLSSNLLYWMGWAAWRLDGNVIQKFRLNGLTNWVFDRDDFRGYLSSVRQDCNVTMSMGYVHEHGEMDMTFVTDDYMKNCMDVADPSLFGYAADSQLVEFGWTVPEIAAMAAHYVNEGVLPLSRLVPVLMKSLAPMNYRGTVYSAGYYSDARYAGMRSIVCYNNTKGTGAREDFICFTELGSNLGYPFFTQKGTEGVASSSRFRPAPCTCDNPLHDLKCNEFDLLVGLIIFEDVNGTALSLEQQFEKAMDMRIATADINSAVYNAVFSSLVTDELKMNDSSATTEEEWRDLARTLSPAYRAQAYSFCSGSCVIVTTRMHDVEFRYVNPTYLELAHASCADSFTISNSSWDRFLNVDNFPERVVENYYECVQTSREAFVSSVGIAFGTVEVVMLGVYMLFLIGCHKREDVHQTVLEESFVLHYDEEEQRSKDEDSQFLSTDDGERISDKAPALGTYAKKALDESPRLRVSRKGGGSGGAGVPVKDDENIANNRSNSNPDSSSSNENATPTLEVMEVEDF